jgi:hypothetical protein
MPAVMAAPANLGDHPFCRLPGGSRHPRIDQRKRLRAFGRNGNDQQSRDSRKSEKRFDIHLHERSPFDDRVSIPTLETTSGATCSADQHCVTLEGSA